MKLTIPELSLIALIGASSSGKSTFAGKHFLPTEVLSSDFCRALVSDSENNMDATSAAFEVLHFIAAKRLEAGRLTVVDATNVQAASRKALVAQAREYHCLPVAIVFNLPESLCQERNRQRPDRDLPPRVISSHCRQLRQSMRGLVREGFRHVFELRSLEEIEAATIEPQPLWTDKRGEHGPFDIIGDVHGCFEELVALLEKLGYKIEARSGDGCGDEYCVTPPEGRKAVFLGDLVDRGPRIPEVLRLVMGMVARGTALCVPGNHDVKLLKQLQGRKVVISHGLAESVAQLAAEPEEFRLRVREFLDGLVSHYVLDRGRLVVAHAGMRAEMQGRGSGQVRDFALYGETTGETDEFGLPVRYNWAGEYRGAAKVVYGHSPVPEPEWLNGTLNIDTGCVFGGSLTALRYPELELVSVPAARVYADPIRPLRAAAKEADGRSAQQEEDDMLDLEDVVGKRLIATRLKPNVLVHAENAATALEVISRFAVNPKWLIYLPPTMSPSETSRREGLLEHPAEAFEYFRREGAGRAICEEKHMGSRTVVIVCRDGAAARRRFGVLESEGSGIIYSRTGRRFFNDAAMEEAMLARVRAAMEAAGFWEEFQTDWACLDCELMPWSAKAQELLLKQYAPVGAAARRALGDAVALLEAAARGNAEAEALAARYRERRELAERYTAAYRRYCWPVRGVEDLRLAPFHLLATEGAVHADKNHVWHMETLKRLCDADSSGVLLATPYKVVELEDEASCAEAAAWWEALTARGGEGMVVKPYAFALIGSRGLAQPAVKCRGREYLRIIYGPEYTLPENLERLRARGLGRKRALALREFALGIEALERFVRREPLRRVHECCLGVLAFESEPTDPRL